MALSNSRQIFGAAFTPRHQGPGERKHIEVMQFWLLLIHQICGTFPQEWDILAPVVEYLLDTDINESGFSAHELQTGYSLLQEKWRGNGALYGAPWFSRNGCCRQTVYQLQGVGLHP